MHFVKLAYSIHTAKASSRSQTKLNAFKSIGRLNASSTFCRLTARADTNAAASTKSAVIKAAGVSGILTKSISAITNVTTPTPTGNARPTRSRRVVAVDMLNTVRYPTAKSITIPNIYMV